MTISSPVAFRNPSGFRNSGESWDSICMSSNKSSKLSFKRSSNSSCVAVAGAFFNTFSVGFPFSCNLPFTCFDFSIEVKVISSRVDRSYSVDMVEVGKFGSTEKLKEYLDPSKLVGTLENDENGFFLMLSSSSPKSSKLSLKMNFRFVPWTGIAATVGTAETVGSVWSVEAKEDRFFLRFSIVFTHAKALLHWSLASLTTVYICLGKCWADQKWHSANNGPFVRGTLWPLISQL